MAVAVLKLPLAPLRKPVGESMPLTTLLGRLDPVNDVYPSTVLLFRKTMVP
jgi:hypothetical protein